MESKIQGIEQCLLDNGKTKKPSSDQVGIVVTYVKTKDVADEMIYRAIEEKLSVRGQYSHVHSTSWWHGEVQTLSEYKVELLCRKSNASKLLKLLKSLHTYALPAFIYQDVMCDEDTQVWVKVV